MTALSTTLRRVCAFGAGLCMALVFAIVFVNATRRYTMGVSVPWGEELPIYLTIYGVMFGLALAYLTDSHIRFSVVTDLLPARARARLFAGLDLVTAATGAGLLWSGVAFGLRRADRAASGLSRAAGDLADATGIAALEWLGRMGPWQMALAFGGALLTLAALTRFAERLSGMRA
jgi:TRAP-type C4-dicarboxylate transport system permease small subunit